MAGKRSQSKSSMVQFLSRLEIDRLKNFSSVIDMAKLVKLDGFNLNYWDRPTWTITAGNLIKLSGRSSRKVELIFAYAPKLGGEPLVDEWSDITKALLVLRYHRKNQAVSNQRNFISAISYVAFEMFNSGQGLFHLTHESLDRACSQISKHYSDAAAYNMHKAVGEFAAHCDANGICNVLLDYKYSEMKRPDSIV